MPVLTPTVSVEGLSLRTWFLEMSSFVLELKGLSFLLSRDRNPGLASILTGELRGRKMETTSLLGCWGLEM